MACSQLSLGKCDLAIAGGASMGSGENTGYLHQKDFIHSHSGHCRPFDKDSSGTVGGRGLGLVVLKRLEDA